MHFGAFFLEKARPTLANRFKSIQLDSGAGLVADFSLFVRGVCRQRGFKQRPQLSSSQSFK
jgi:hypothetical protein